MKKYILVINIRMDGYLSKQGGIYSTLEYYDDLIGIYRKVCRDLTVEDEDIEDLEAEDIAVAIEENEKGYYVFKMGETEPFAGIDPEGSDLEKQWDKFSKECFAENESIVMSFTKFKS